MQALNPFRRQLFNELYATNELVRAFAGGLPGGRLMLPAMDDWTLGILRRKRNFFTIFSGNYKQPNTGGVCCCYNTPALHCKCNPLLRSPAHWPWQHACWLSA